MSIKFFNLQLFADGGDGAGAASGTGSDSGAAAGNTGVNGDSPVSQNEDLSKVMYGISDKGTNAQENSTNTPKTEDKAKAFENMIKKGGEYADEFNKRTQNIIDKRFKDYKGLQNTLNSHNDIMEALAAKYGVDAKDADAVLKAINDDTSMYEEAAFKEGLTVEQYKEKVQLQKENARLKEAEQHREEQAHAQQTYANWLDEGNNFAARYGIQDFDFNAECENPDFTNLLRAGTSVEAAYKAVHFDDMVGGAMAKTADNVTQALAQRVATRNARPSENALVSSNTNTMKSDVNQLNGKDIDEIIRRVHAGERITFG